MKNKGYSKSLVPTTGERRSRPESESAGLLSDGSQGEVLKELTRIHPRLLGEAMSTRFDGPQVFGRSEQKQRGVDRPTSDRDARLKDIGACWT